MSEVEEEEDEDEDGLEKVCAEVGEAKEWIVMASVV